MSSITNNDNNKMKASISVILLTTPSTKDFVNKVSESLCTPRFSIRKCVLIRNGMLSASTFLLEEDEMATSSLTRKLFVAFEVTDTVRCLIQESCYPVLVLDKERESLAAVEDATIQIVKFCSLSGNLDYVTALDRVLISRHQAALVDDATSRTQSPAYLAAIANCYDTNMQITGNNIHLRNEIGIKGKVRDRFESSDTSTKIALVTTDRQSGFDRQLALVPLKGAVLNLCSAFWFERTVDIIPNHVISTPHPYVTISKKCKPFPIEFVVRAYMTGSTSTSIWKNYLDGLRLYCGHALPDGMKKNQSLDICGGPMLTPTTKEEEHDRPISCEDIIKEKWMTKEDLDVCATAALKVFQRGQEIASQHGLVLVDTKYEFGRCLETNEILLIDEVHTPDSSRYWIASTYEDRIATGNEPDNIDKEFLRLWFTQHCDPYKDETIPDAPRDLVLELSRRYIQLYEMITSKTFDFDSITGEDAISKAIEEGLFSQETLDL